MIFIHLFHFSSDLTKGKIQNQTQNENDNHTNQYAHPGKRTPCIAQQVQQWTSTFSIAQYAVVARACVAIARTTAGSTVKVLVAHATPITGGPIVAFAIANRTGTQMLARIAPRIKTLPVLNVVTSAALVNRALSKMLG